MIEMTESLHNMAGRIATIGICHDRINSVCAWNAIFPCEEDSSTSPE